jgi:hypothetical protein
MPDEATTDLLDELAERIRMLYWAAHNRFMEATQGVCMGRRCRTMPQWDGGTDARGVCHKPIWPKIALRLLHDDIPPEKAIAALFDAVVGAQPPFPNQLLSDNLTAKLKRQPGHQLTQVRYRFQAEQTAVKLELGILRRNSSLDDRLIQRMVLVSRSVPLSPLFRFIMALQTGNRDLATDYESAAFFQYLGHRSQYDEIYGTNLPGEFRSKADQLRGIVS